MKELVELRKLGDITFGMPSDVAFINTPFAFYKVLGLKPEATKEQIRKAYLLLSKAIHPDIGGDTAQFQVLKHVYKVLSDDGGELGEEHSKKRHYNIVSSWDTLFDGFITIEKERTKKLSEILLANLEIDRHFAETRQKIGAEYPRFGKLVDKLEEEEDKEKRRGIFEEIFDITAKVQGITTEDIANLRKQREKHQQEQEEKNKKFYKKIKKTQPEILDVLHVGGGSVGLGTSTYYLGFEILDHDIGKAITHLIIQGEKTSYGSSTTYLAGFRQVHFKSTKANVSITDPHMVGIVHVVEGNVNVEYDGTSYGEVIAVKAPEVGYDSRFAKHENKFIPKRFAKGEWWKKKPALDIRVADGKITLKLKSEKISPYAGYFGLGDYIKSDLNKISEYEKKNDNLEEIISHYIPNKEKF